MALHRLTTITLGVPDVAPVAAYYEEFGLAPLGDSRFATADGGEQLRIVVNDGFAEVAPQGLTVLADAAVPLDEFDRSVLAGLIKDTEEDVADNTDAWQRDKLARRLEQLRTLQAALGS